MKINPLAKRYPFASVYKSGLNAFNLDSGQGLFSLKPRYWNFKVNFTKSSYTHSDNEKYHYYKA